MTGTIFLGGGGGASDEELLWRAMLDGKRRVLYWPFALPPHMVSGAERWLTSSLRELQMDVEVETWADLRRRDPDGIANADLLFVGGGNTFRLLDHVRRHGFEQPVRDFVAAGGYFYGRRPASLRTRAAGDRASVELGLWVHRPRRSRAGGSCRARRPAAGRRTR